MLFLLHVNFLVIDVLLTRVLSSSAVEEVKAWLPSATSKSRQTHFLRQDKLEALVLHPWLVILALVNKNLTEQ